MMRAGIRRISMASMPPGPSSRLTNLIAHLRLYSPPPPPPPPPPPRPFLGKEDEDDIDERGKVFSHIGLVESSVAPAEKFRPRRAAVLVCLFEGDSAAGGGGGDLRVILTKRSSQLSTHSGEVSLPGGKAEEGDADDAETATREAKEEIGLHPTLVTVVNVLEPFLSKVGSQKAVVLDGNNYWRSVLSRNKQALGYSFWQHGTIELDERMKDEHGEE